MSWMRAGKSTFAGPAQRTRSASLRSTPRSSMDLTISSTKRGLPSAFPQITSARSAGVSLTPSRFVTIALTWSGSSRSRPTWAE